MSPVAGKILELNAEFNSAFNYCHWCLSL
jgi:hypothetical protein